jgi:hypothetical protein
MGCAKSKDATNASQPKQIGTKEGQQPAAVGTGVSPSKKPVSEIQSYPNSPSKQSPSKPIKAVSEAELSKHKVSDLIAFIKNGNLSMVHGLINHFRLARSVTQVRGSSDEFTFGKHGGQQGKVSMANWNPVLLAIGYKKVDILRYLINELKISLSTSATAPDASVDARYAL